MPFIVGRFGGIRTDGTTDGVSPGGAIDGHDFILGEPAEDGGLPLIPGGLGRTRVYPGAAPSSSGIKIYQLDATDFTNYDDGYIMVAVDHSSSKIVSIRRLEPGNPAASLRAG